MRTGAYAEDAERRAKTCCSAADALDAQSVADRLDIPFYALDFERDFARIQDYFADEYLAGRTPNPCVMCNIWLKFGKLWAYGKQVGADFVATGHYARVLLARRRHARAWPVRSTVARTSRTSCLAYGRSCCRTCCFRWAAITKSEIRAIAREHGLAGPRQARQPGDLLRAGRRLPRVRARPPAGPAERAGPIVDEDGTVLGEHSGIEGFTIGQRRGLGIALGSPRYVVQIEPLTRTVTVGRKASPGEDRAPGRSLQLAGPRAVRPGPLPGPDPRPASRRAGARSRLSPTDVPA